MVDDVVVVDVTVPEIAAVSPAKALKVINILYKSWSELFLQLHCYSNILYLIL